jgi:putative glutathione S-transferase
VFSLLLAPISTRQTHNKPPPTPSPSQTLKKSLTEADLRLFPTVARFDAVYASLFRCGRKRIADYPHLYAWARDVHQIKVPGGGLQVSDLTTFDLDAARRSYFTNLFPLSPSGIVPAGPTMAELAFGAPHGRGSGALEDVFWLRE